MCISECGGERKGKIRSRQDTIAVYQLLRTSSIMAPTTAATLKEEGNALFVAKKYKAALAKYTAALDLDHRNAVLYANRAACHLALRECVLALGDPSAVLNLNSWDRAYDDAQKARGVLVGHGAGSDRRRTERRARRAVQQGLGTPRRRSEGTSYLVHWCTRC
jgi:tetratricopeptide (TPR) repeat protein